VTTATAAAPLAARSKAGNDGIGGSDGQPGAFSVGVGSDCDAASAVCN